MRKALSLPSQSDGTPFTLDSLVRAVLAVPKKVVDKADAKLKRNRKKRKK